MENEEVQFKETPEEVRDKEIKEPFMDSMIRISALVILVATIVLDFMGFKSEYTSFILGGSVTLYILGKKGIMLILGKYSGYSLKELDDYFKK